MKTDFAITINLRMSHFYFTRNIPCGDNSRSHHWVGFAHFIPKFTSFIIKLRENRDTFALKCDENVNLAGYKSNCKGVSVDGISQLALAD